MIISRTGLGKVKLGMADSHDDSGVSKSDLVEISDVRAVNAIKKVEDFDLGAFLSVEGCDLLSFGQYNYPDEAIPYIQSTVDSLLEQGVIRPCHSSCLSPIWPVCKTNGSWRLCIDYWELKKYPPVHTPVVATTPDVLASLLPEANYYSALDASNGFWSIPWDPDCQYKFAFQFKSMQYTWNILPQGFANSLTLFHHCLAKVVEPFSRPECLITHVDYLLLQIGSREHLHLLAELLALLERAGLKLNPKKVQLMKSEVTYLGIKVSKGGHTPDPYKWRLFRDFRCLCL